MATADFKRGRRPRATDVEPGSRQPVIEGFYFRDKERKGYLTADQLPEASRDAFNAANVKHDGRLSLEEELNALLKDFEAADLDKDGTLTYEELEAYVKRSSH